MAEKTLVEIFNEAVDESYTIDQQGNLERPVALIIELALKAVIEAHESRKWQPIETAPKDGTKIIGIDGTLIYTYRFLLNGGWSIELRSAFLNTSAPDFWQPLQAPPKQGD